MRLHPKTPARITQAQQERAAKATNEDLLEMLIEAAQAGDETGVPSPTDDLVYSIVRAEFDKRMQAMLPPALVPVLIRHCRRIGHEHNCSSARGSDNDCTCGATEWNRWAAKVAGDLRHCAPCKGNVDKAARDACGFGRCPFKLDPHRG